MRKPVSNVSVVIPAYRAGGSMERCLESVRRQSRPPAEVIIVDDGSDDGTADVVRVYQRLHPELAITLFEQENQGAGAARNKGVALASQDIIAFLDADDEWLEDKLSRSLEVMHSGGYALVAHDYLMSTPEGDKYIDCVRRFDAPPDPFTSLYRLGYIPSISVLAYKADILSAGGFDSSLRNAQDFDLWLSILRHPAKRFVVFGEALARYHHSPDGIMSHTERRIACCMRIAERYFPDLKRRRAPAWRSLWLRILAIYVEAARSYVKKKQYWRAALLVVRCLTDGFVSTIRVLHSTIFHADSKTRRPVE